MQKGFLLITLLLCLGCSSSKVKDGSFKGTEFDHTVQVVFTPDGAQVTGDEGHTVRVEENHVTHNIQADSDLVVLVVQAVDLAPLADLAEEGRDPKESGID